MNSRFILPVRKPIYGIDMEATKYSKLLTELPAVDTVITRGCNVQCPHLPCNHRDDWGLEDPTGKPDEVFKEVIRSIHQHILQLQA